LAKRKGVKEIKILLLGDIVDLIKSTKWLDSPVSNRPWGAKGLADIPKPRRNSPTEKQCLKILGQVSAASLERAKPPTSLERNTILYQNWKTFKLLREIKRYFTDVSNRDLQVEVIYVPGNHDRLCNLYPSLRKELSRLLGLTLNADTVDGDPAGEWWFKDYFISEDYGVYARHGHQYDVWNFGGGNDFSREGHLQAPIGDVITTEFAVKIPWLLESMRKKYPKLKKQLVEKTKDIDNVRPLGSVIEWLYYRIRKEDQVHIRKALDEAFDKAIKELLRFDLVRQWRSPYTHYDEILRAASSRWLSWMPQGLVDLLDAEDLLGFFLKATGGTDDPEKDLYLQSAYNESIWKSNRDIQFIAYGHTHRPLQRPLEGDEGREVFYINTGTWRNRIHKTVGLDRAPNFVDLKQMTYTVFYRRDEDTGDKEPNSLSFDIWTGIKKKYYRQA
jgi:UDP-2,3-diacylglucosamine pyrophosphatase LpxH